MLLGRGGAGGRPGAPGLFLPGQRDVFHFQLPDLGTPLVFVRVGHDGVGDRARWLLDRLTVQDLTVTASPAVNFPCGEGGGGGSSQVNNGLP